ncbi:MAG TPA: 2OG-Fe(II) oxygenase [Gemmatimonadaceae bacterium]|jgi:hypothetical protein
MNETTAVPIASRIRALDWPRVTRDLNERGCAVLPGVLARDECRDIAAMFDQKELFRSTVIMARHGFGRGQYRYWTYPLPQLVNDLRVELYSPLAAIANGWNESMKIETRYPETHEEYIDVCHQAGQTRPTPLLLSYNEGDWNALHQDLYGANVFPMQVAFLLSQPGEDFTGGEFVLVEQRPRMQSRAEVVELRQGDAVIFAVSHRPVQGAKGTYRVNLRHGVSRIRSGHRTTMGIIFHDAE